MEILGSVIFLVNGKRHRSFFGITYSGLLGVRLLDCIRGNISLVVDRSGGRV